MTFGEGVPGIGQKELQKMVYYKINKVSLLYHRQGMYHYIWYTPLEKYKQIEQQQTVLNEDRELLLNILAILIHYFSYDPDLIVGVNSASLRDHVTRRRDKIRELTRIRGVDEKLAICLYRAGYKTPALIFTDPAVRDVLVDDVPGMYSKILSSWHYGVLEANKIYTRLLVMKTLNCDLNVGVGPPNVNFPGG